MASQIAIKMLGTNGGGYVNANAAHPFENPTPLSNFLQMLSIFAIPSGLTWYLGRSVKNQAHGWAVWAAMFVIFLAGVSSVGTVKPQAIRTLPKLALIPPTATWRARKHVSASSTLRSLPRSQPTLRAGGQLHARFIHSVGRIDSPLNIQLGEVVFGGVGAGLYGMLVYVVIAVFIAGLMVGRTPEFSRKNWPTMLKWPHS